MIKEQEGIGEKAIPFIEFRPGKGFKITKEAAEFLTSLPKEKKIGVVSIVGKYRTGKSFLINRILLKNKKKVFGVGNTINACTKGLWLYTSLIKSSSPENSDMEILVMDTEGFGGIEENVNHDTRIFLFAILLSSYFIYNSVGNIDENALQTLNLVIEMAKEIKKSDSGEGFDEEEILDVFPSFLWIVRDFSLKLTNNSGKKISSKEYLEGCLKMIDGASQTAFEKNKIRKMLKYFFQKRDCVTMIRPVETETELQMLSTLKEHNMRPDFVKQMQTVRNKILWKTKVKKFKGREINGEMLLHLAKAYCESVNKGTAPSIQSAWYYLSKNETEKAKEQSILLLEKELASVNFFEKNFELPKWKRKIRKQVQILFRKMAIGDEEDILEIEERLEDEIEERIKQVEMKAGKRKESEVKKFFEKKNRELVNMIKEGSVQNYHQCEEKIKSLENDFEDNFSGICEEKKEVFLNEFKAKVQKELFSWISMEQKNQRLRESQAMEHKIRELSQSKEKEVNQSKNTIVNLRNQLKESEKRRIEIEMKSQNVEFRVQELEQELRSSKKKLSLQGVNFENTRQKFVEEYSKKNENLTRELSELKNTHIREMSELEKRISLLEQELKFRKKEISSLSDQVTRTKEEKARLEKEILDLKEELKNREQLTDDEIVIKKSAYMNMEQTIHKNIEKIHDLEKNCSEERLERQIAYNKIEMLGNQLKDSKKMHEGMIESLNNRLKADELNRTQVSQLKKNIETEIQSKISKLEQQNERLKSYKTILKYATTLQCANCNRFISTPMFVDHIKACLPPDQNPFNPTPSNHGSYSQTKMLNFNQLSAMTVSIPQTMVRENPNNKRPYTEYIIQVMTKSCQWAVARKYRAFCELHNQLTSTFPFVQFPESAKEIFGMSSNLSILLNSRKSSVIDDRRKCLQNYIKDLLRVDVLRNSPLLRNFLEIDKFYDTNDQLIVEGGVKIDTMGSDEDDGEEYDRTLNMMDGMKNNGDIGKVDDDYQDLGSMRSSRKELSEIGGMSNMLSSRYEEREVMSRQQYFLRKLNAGGF